MRAAFRGAGAPGGPRPGPSGPRLTPFSMSSLLSLHFMKRTIFQLVLQLTELTWGRNGSDPSHSPGEGGVFRPPSPGGRRPEGRGCSDFSRPCASAADAALDRELRVLPRSGHHASCLSRITTASRPESPVLRPGRRGAGATWTQTGMDDEGEDVSRAHALECARHPRGRRNLRGRGPRTDSHEHT